MHTNKQRVLPMATKTLVPAHTVRYFATEQYRAYMYRGVSFGIRKTVNNVELRVSVQPGGPSGKTMVHVEWMDNGKLQSKTIKAARSWLHG
jgi:hypothetical protein